MTLLVLLFITTNIELLVGFVIMNIIRNINHRVLVISGESQVSIVHTHTQHFSSKHQPCVMETEAAAVSYVEQAPG